MKLFKHMKDGGPLSRVHGYWLIEAKRLLSVVLLHFLDGSREAYHTHAFNAVSWVIKGKLVEDRLDGVQNVYTPSIFPIFTPRDCFHKVTSVKGTWALSFRGPWVDTWKEYLPDEDKFITLISGRRII